ncbi:hypothetical protein GDO78_008370 [Eleutherodactylus coqui]|uniref:Uncharacterized protein n=1 Tax=Eleutherodactylus coqui TaxID=57060 RepID=A0A8J6FC05_ELECQ|nr:hypothetical protein GDO78_008370 [Eleutherodactylus coqui]
MSSFLKKAEKKAEETVKHGEHAAHDCAEKGKEHVKHGEHAVHDCVEKGKEMGKHVVDEGCKAAENACDDAAKKFEGWKK